MTAMKATIPVNGYGGERGQKDNYSIRLMFGRISARLFDRCSPRYVPWDMISFSYTYMSEYLSMHKQLNRPENMSLYSICFFNKEKAH